MATSCPGAEEKLTATALVLFARCDSRRLPGKVMRPVVGRHLIGRVLDRLRLVEGDYPIIIATSDRPIDDPIAEFAQQEEVAVFRGASADVADRALRCAEHHGIDRIVRICGDSPFSDHSMVPALIRLHSAKELDVATNVFPRSYPPGTSIEVISAMALRRVLLATKAPEDREHVTRYFYRHPESFTIENISAGDDRYAGVNLAVDTAEDFARTEWIMRRIDGAPEHASLDQIVALSRSWVAAQPLPRNQA